MQDIMPTWVGATAKQIARGVRRGDVSATQVVADHLDHIARADADLAAFRAVRGGEAITEAEKVDEQEDLANLPLAGVPVAVKENTPVAGLPTWNGSAAARTAVAEADHEVVRRLRGAGAVILGVTRMPELGLWALTDDETAVTRNPWDPTRTPGGSSGGAAAAVAAGLVPMAHGNDGLGSIRIPAACCGLVGLKPGRGVVPCQLGADDWFGLTEHGMLDHHGRRRGGRLLGARRPSRRTKLVPPPRLRVGVSLRSPGARRVAGRAQPGRGGRRRPAARRRRARHRHPPTRSTRPRSACRASPPGSPRPPPTCEAAGVDRRACSGAPAGTSRWASGRSGAGTSGRPTGPPGGSARSSFFADHSVDLLLTPALAGPPPEAAGWSGRSWRGEHEGQHPVRPVRRAVEHRRPARRSWCRSGVRPDGLPVAVQLVGPPGSELLLLGVAGQFEMQAPWQRHAPGYPRVGTGSPAAT